MNNHAPDKKVSFNAGVWIEIFSWIEHYIIMKVNPLFSLLCVVLFICSCRMDYGEFSSEPDNSVVQDVAPRLFWAFNYRTSEYYLITANLFTDGRYCRIWVEQGARVTAAATNNVADIFDRYIYPRMMSTFGIYGSITFNGEIIARNTMQLADWLGDGDGKLTILLLDIQDNYQPGVNSSRTAGYFSSTDLWGNRPYSNKADMLYIDTNPERPGSVASNKTIAHEMQHLMNFVTSILQRSDTAIHEMDTWINEGLSAIAEWVYYEEHSEDRWSYYNSDPSGLLRKGNNFFIWGNRTNEHSYAELDDYATVYLFFHWLRLQSGGTDIFSDLIKSNKSNYLAVTEAAGNAIKGAGYGDWDTLLRTWLVANYINAGNGPYGYKGDRALRNIKAKTIPEGTETVRLFPGEGVFSLTRAGYVWPAAEGNIKYAGLTNRSPWVSATMTFPNGALLTYNANPNANGGQELGKTSGIASKIDTTIYDQRVKALLAERTVIDLTNMLGSNRYDETPEPAMAGAAIGNIKLGSTASP